MVQNQYISSTETAKRLGISRIAVFNRIKSGAIKAEKIGRNYAIPVSEIERLTKPKLSEADKREINKAVAKTVQEYGETLKLLGNA